jgi:hypothetical protein
VGQGLFEEQVLARARRGLRDRRVEDGRHDRDDRLDARIFDERAPVRMELAAVRGGHGAALARVATADGDERGVLDILGEMPDVSQPVLARPDDADPERAHVRGL